MTVSRNWYSSFGWKNEDDTTIFGSQLGVIVSVPQFMVRSGRLFSTDLDMI